MKPVPVTVSFQTDEQMHADLRAVARASGGRSVSSLLRRAVRKILDEQSQVPAKRREVASA
jgi:hypothetical protein